MLTCDDAYVENGDEIERFLYSIPNQLVARLADLNCGTVHLWNTATVTQERPRRITIYNSRQMDGLEIGKYNTLHNRTGQEAID